MNGFFKGLYQLFSHFLWGDIFSPGLLKTIKEDNDSIVPVNGGQLYGSVVFIKPDDRMNLDALVNQLDTQTHGRLEQGPADLVGGSVLSARTDGYAKTNHHIFGLLLSRPAQYIDAILASLEKFTAMEAGACHEYELSALTSMPLRNTLIKGLFGLEQTPQDLQHALENFSFLIQDKLDNFGKTLSVKLMGAYYSWFLKFIPRYKQAKEEYLRAAAHFMDTQAVVILEIFKNLDGDLNFLDINNLLARSIIQKIKEKKPNFALRENQDALVNFLQTMTENDLRPYLNDPYIKSLPALTLPSDMIVIPLTCALTELARNPALVADLRADLERRQLFCEGYEKLKSRGTHQPAHNDLSDKIYDNMRNNISLDRDSGGLLHRIFLESMRRDLPQKTVEHLEGETTVLRYAEQEIEVRDRKEEIVGTIPRNSTLIFMNALSRFDPKIWPRPEIFDPSRFLNDHDKILEKKVLSIFFFGERKCPARQIVEYIFQTYVAYIVENFELELVKSDNVLPSVKIRLTAREPSAYLSESRFAVPGSSLSTCID